MTPVKVCRACASDNDAVAAAMMSSAFMGPAL
jgi:hypothetical protein